MSKHKTVVLDFDKEMSKSHKISIF